MPDETPTSNETPKSDKAPKTGKARIPPPPIEGSSRFFPDRKVLDKIEFLIKISEVFKMKENENNEKRANSEKTSGNISVEAENIFPVIKKWLYSDKEIFLREIVSNACDAVTKLKRLRSLGQIESEGEEEPPFRVDVFLDKEERTLTVSDNGIGMTLEEVDKYICNIALSGAVDFMAKYEKDSSSNGIIGHFGLGFYSAFMVSDKVEVRSRSYTGAPTTLWVCDENGSYTYGEPEERSRGTDIIMHLSEEGEEFLDEWKVREVLQKYCSFMPVEIYFSTAEKEKEKEAKKTKDKKSKDGEQDDAGEQEEKPINDTSPLWLKNPSECSDEEYSSFYRKVFNDYKEPLFHIHINADYPLNFKGILYFPKISSEYENLEGQVKLFYNQVFVADNIKEVIPEYFLMLKGVLDCPELPLNVSRSYLQNSGYVSKISAHIVKKTADKLCGMFTNDKTAYEKIWNDVKLFVEYGCLKDRKFYDRVKKAILIATTDGSYLPAEEYAKEAKEKTDGKIYYCTDKVSQAQYIALYESQGIRVAVFDRILDGQFISLLENEEKVKFFRVDAEVSDALKGDGKSEENKELTALFKEVAKDPELTVDFAVLKDENVPAILNIDEQNRRMTDMMKAYGMDTADLKDHAKIIVNSSSPLIQKLISCADPEKKKAATEQIYSLALLSQRQLTAEELRQFLERSFKVLELGL